MQQSLSRNLVVIEGCCNLDDAREKAVAQSGDLCKDLTVIDTTTDFNQNKWLGQELSHTLIYLNSNTRINGLLAVSGCVKGGNFLFFAFAKDNYGAFFQKYATPTLKKIADETAAVKEKNWPPLPPNAGAGFLDDTNLEQLKVLINKQAEHNVTHIIGERGAGKSSLLGQYIHNICSNDGVNSSAKNRPHVALVSPSRQSSDNTFKQLTNVSRETFMFLPPTKIDNSVLAMATHVIVDEAASISRGVLNRIREQVSGVLIFATTIDGYEGTGQSYRLSMMRDGENLLYLDEPKRFCAADKLYQWGQQLCRPRLLSKMLVATEQQTTVCSIKQAHGNNWVVPAFALLQSAHYRTTPNDLANLYDNDGFLAVNAESGEMIGAAHALPEEIDEVDDELITQIFYGRRRLKNAMTQQALVHAYGVREIADKKILRVSRIAVAEQFRQKGHGAALINALVNYARENHFDFLSTSFSCQADTLAFWLSQGFIPVRIGINKNKWHDSFSVMMVRPLHDVSELIMRRLQQKFAEHLSYYLPVYYESDYNSTALLINAAPTLYHNASEKNKSEQDNSVILSKRQLGNIIDSVIAHHRDVHWVLPGLYALQQRNDSLLSTEAWSLLVPYFTQQLLDKKEKSNAKNALLFLKTYLGNCD